MVGRRAEWRAVSLAAQLVESKGLKRGERKVAMKVVQ